MCSAPTTDPGLDPHWPDNGLRQMALHAAQAGIWEWDLQTNANRWSAELWPLYGLDPQQHTACYEHWLLSVHPDDREAAAQTVQAARRQGVPFETEWRTNPGLGPTRWLLSRGRPGRAGQDGPHTYVGVVMDITARKHAELSLKEARDTLEGRVAERTSALAEQQRLLQTMLDGMPGMVGYWDATLHNRFANRAYEAWFGKQPRDILGQPIGAVLGPELLELNRAAIEAALRGEPQHFVRDIPIPGQPGQYRISDTQYLPDIHDGQVKGFLVLVSDVTEVRMAAREARAASQAKSEFLANVSHELRTPLNAMFGLAQIGARDTAGTPTSHTFHQILESGQHLLSLINDVLDFSKIEAGKMALQSQAVDLGQLLEQALSLGSLKAAAKGLSLVVEESPRVPRRVQGDATRVAQILLNLLTNAIKFTERGEVRLALDHDQHNLILSVQDTGIGIPAERLGSLFQPFVQAHEGAEHGGGTGLGLAICKRLALIMGGDIEVRSTQGMGSVFRVHLPLPALPALPETPRVARSVALAGWPEATARWLTAGLSRHGEQPSQHARALEALASAEACLLHEEALRQLHWGALEGALTRGQRVLVGRLSAPTGALTVEGHPLPSEVLVLQGPPSALRLQHALDRQTLEPAHRRHRLTGLRILAAEDNPVNRLILGQMLEAEGANVHFAVDGAEAVAQVRQSGGQAFDIVLCDIQMPVMDGLEATRRIKRMAPALPIVGLTAHAFVQAREQALASGMDDYVTKPYMLDALVSVILRHAAAASPAAPSPAPSAQAARPASTHAVPPALTASDWEATTRHFAPQPGMLSRLCEVAEPSLRGVLARLSGVEQTGQLAALGSVAHEIKGIALNLRAPQLAQLATATQDKARQHDPLAFELLPPLHTALSDYLGAMQAAMQAATACTAASAQHSPLSSVDQPVGTDVAQNGGGNFLNRLVRR